MDHGGSQVVIKLVFYFDDPTNRVRIPLKTILFYEKMFEKSENKQKEAGDGPFFQKNV